MLENNAGRISASAALALALTACSGGSGGSGFTVSTCSLGCSGGSGGQQIACGVVGIAENQEISLTFTSPVDPFSVTKESFAVRDAITGASAAGTRFVDPTNPNRLIFRPKLGVAPNGDPIFGFEAGRAYEIFLNGVVQNDPPPYVTNLNGNGNEARVNCTVEASQGIVDTLPGKPSVQIFVTVEDPGGGTTQQELMLGQTPGAQNVKTLSTLRLEFDELMDISTMFNPSTGTSPNIAVLLDVDGNPLTTSDRATIPGSYAYGYDQTAQTTTLLFTPSNGFPSLGADELNPRLVVVTLGPNITDIAGNQIDVPGTYNFVPKQVLFPSATMPAGGEQFTDQNRLDEEASGSPWGTDVAGRLTPGEGGGSGRHGELVVAAGQTVVLHSSEAKASAVVEFLLNPQENDILTIAGVEFTFKETPLTDVEAKIQYNGASANIAYTISTLVEQLNDYVLANPGSAVAAATFTQLGHNKMLVEAVAPGIPSPPYSLAVSSVDASDPYASVSSGTLAGGFVAHTFSDPDIVTNFDFSAATGIPGGTPPDLVVADGLFEFSRVSVEPTGTLVLQGDAPVRILSRGEFVLADQGVVDLSGESQPGHLSHTPYGQPGGKPGPGAGRGGRGGDRSNQPTLANSSAIGVTVANPVANGEAGVGVGGVAAAGEGLGGLRWPSLFPVGPMTFNGWCQTPGCTSGQYANTGSGGAYTLDGDDGDTQVSIANGTAQNSASIPNKPVIGNTVGGDAAQVGLEPASANPTGNRLLTPAMGHLLGGAGGGGGGAHVAGTTTALLGSACFAEGFSLFPDNSSAGGGGGGGAAQIQAGGLLSISGQILASGGDGGSAGASATTAQRRAAPGGGGSGGAVLLQGGTLALANQPSRILVNGGEGGTGGDTNAPSTAGAGSPGIVRVEQRGAAPDATTVAASVFPTDGMDPTSVNWLSVGEWLYLEDDVATMNADEFESVTGSQSCWLQVPGPFFSLTFESDPAAPAAPGAMSWNMDVILDDGMGGEVTVPWRGSDGAGHFMGQYPEEYWGTLLNRDLGMGETASPIVVRFQGLRTTGQFDFPCDVDLTDPNEPIVIGSVTPWVQQPEELNAFLPLVTSARFLVLFDRSHPEFPLIKGVTNLRIEVQPE